LAISQQAILRKSVDEASFHLLSFDIDADVGVLFVWQQFNITPLLFLAPL